MKYMKKYKHHRPPRYEVTVKIDGIGVIKHVMSLPESESKTRHDIITDKLHRAYPKRAVTILRIQERR